MKNKKKLEQSILLTIYSTKRILDIFLGPFLTAYFIKTSKESMCHLAIYYMFAFAIMALTCFIVAKITKNKFKLAMFRIGIILNSIYILSIIFLQEKIVDHLFLMATLYGLSNGTYWFPYNIFAINKVDNIDRTDFTVKSRIATSIVGILCPILLGSFISATNYILTAIIILIISFAQILFSFVLTSDPETQLPKYNIKQTWNKLKNNVSVKRSLLVEFFIGMNLNDGALEILITILIFSSLKTDINLGIITSLVTILTMIAIHFYGKKYKHKNDKNLILLSSITPVFTVFLLLATKNLLAILLYRFCYAIFANLLSVAKEIRLYNLSNSNIIGKEHQIEFLTIRELFLNSGRTVSYILLLIAGLSNNEFIFNIILIILTLSILATGLNIKKAASPPTQIASQSR